jgi:hypothetical protein
MVDFVFLRQRGIELLQQLCGDSWTDYNLHDPGVTILEALCYALTDLSYRTEFPMGDLLADKEGKIRLHDHAFHTREEILSSSPVSVADCRKFILDQMDSLQNVWLEPYISGFSFGTMHGLYTMKVQVKKDYSARLGLGGGQVDKEWVAALGKEVRGCHMSARNLCEDVIRDVTILRPVPLWIRAEVVITGEQPELILAHIYRDLEMAINPPVRYYTERELLEKGYRVEEIHAGPRLSKGHIPDDGLQPRKTHVDPAELMKAVAQVAGVGYVRSLVLQTPEGPTDRIPYQLPEDGYPYFRDGLEESPIRLLRGKYDVTIRESVFDDIWRRVKEAMWRSVEPVVDPTVSSSIRHGEYRDVLYYHSLQHLFPVAYGIGEDGPGARPSALRLAQVQQLKGYLLSFEQVLADYLAQLGHIGEYFSVVNKGRTFYTQPLYNVPGVRDLLGNGYEQALAEVTETEEDYLTRRGAVLDHLLARFNERPVDYPVRLYGQLYGEEGHPVLEWKSWLLGNIVRLGYGRVRGFNYLDREGKDRGGFEERMRALLYIRDGAGVSLANGVASSMQMRRGEVSAGERSGTGDSRVEPQNQNWVNIVDADTMRQRMSAGAGRVSEGRPVDGAGRTPTEDEAHFGHRGMGFFRHGLNIGNYTIGPDIQGSGWLILFKEQDERGWQVIGRHADERSAIEGLRGIMQVLRGMSKQSEGFYLVENVLLRPAVGSESFGFRFRAAGKDVLMQHARWMGFQEREQVLTEILKAAETGPGAADAGETGAGEAGDWGSADAWVPEDAGGEDDEAISEWGVRNLGGRCRIQLTRHKDFGFLSDPADLEPWIWLEAAKDFRRIREQLLLFSENKLKFYPRFDMLVKGQGDNEIREDFFNFNMTVVLPAWPARFQDLNFRAFVMDVFRQQTPAHIRLYFQWLNVTRMKEFESIYPNWIQAMKDQDDPGPRRHWSDRLIHFIKRGAY